MDIGAAVGSIAEKTDNNIILFILALGVVIMACLLPIYRMMIKDGKERREFDAKREEKLVSVVTANTAALAVLQETLREIGELTRENGELTVSTVRRIHERMDYTADKDDINKILEKINHISAISPNSKEIQTT